MIWLRQVHDVLLGCILGLFISSVPSQSLAQSALEKSCFVEERFTGYLPAKEIEQIIKACSSLIERDGNSAQRALYVRSIGEFTRLVQARLARMQRRDGSFEWSNPTHAEFRSALDDLDRAMDLKGEFKAPALRFRATLNQFIGNDAAVLMDLNEAIELDPANAIAYQQRALHWERKKEQIGRAHV